MIIGRWNIQSFFSLHTKTTYNNIVLLIILLLIFIAQKKIKKIKNTRINKIKLFH